MTKEQAFKNLSLPADADIETIRMRFAARYTLSDAQYDHTLTDGMKAVHEQHLRDLEQAYKVTTDNPVIADMGALLSLGKGYVEENGRSIGGDDSISADEALAFFSLYPYDTPVLAEQRYTQYVAELEEAMEQVGLEASKESYRQEIVRAENHLNVVINYLLASQMLASQQEEIAETAGAHESMTEPEMEESAEPAYAAPPASKTINKRQFAIIGVVAIALLTIGIWIGKGSGTDEDNNGRPDSSAQVHMETEIPQRSASNPKSRTAQPEIAETPTAVPQNTEKAEITKPQLSPEETIKALLDAHTEGYKVIVTKGQIVLHGEPEYTLPIPNIHDINTNGEFVSISSERPFIKKINNQPQKVTKGIRLVNVSNEVRARLMKEIRKIQPARSSADNTVNPPADPVTETAKKEVVPAKTESIRSATPKKDTVASAGSKAATDEKNTAKRDTVKKAEQPATEPPVSEPNATVKENTAKDTTAKP